MWADLGKERGVPSSRHPMMQEKARTSLALAPPLVLPVVTKAAVPKDASASEWGGCWVAPATLCRQGFFGC